MITNSIMKLSLMSLLLSIAVSDAYAIRAAQMEGGDLEMVQQNDPCKKLTKVAPPATPTAEDLAGASGYNGAPCTGANFVAICTAKDGTKSKYCATVPTGQSPAFYQGIADAWQEAVRSGAGTAGM